MSDTTRATIRTTVLYTLPPLFSGAEEERCGTPAPCRYSSFIIEAGTQPVYTPLGVFFGEPHIHHPRGARQTRGHNTSGRYYPFLVYSGPRSLPALYIRKPLSIRPGPGELPRTGQLGPSVNKECKGLQTNTLKEGPDKKPNKQPYNERYQERHGQPFVPSHWPYPSPPHHRHDKGRPGVHKRERRGPEDCSGSALRPGPGGDAKRARR